MASGLDLLGGDNKIVDAADQGARSGLDLLGIEQPKPPIQPTPTSKTTTPTNIKYNYGVPEPFLLFQTKNHLRLSRRNLNKNCHLVE